MWNLRYNTDDLSYKTEINSQRTDLWLPVEGWERRIGSLGLTEANYYIYDGQTTRSYCIAQAAIFSIL